MTKEGERGRNATPLFPVMWPPESTYLLHGGVVREIYSLDKIADGLSAPHCLDESTLRDLVYLMADRERERENRKKRFHSKGEGKRM